MGTASYYNPAAIANAGIGDAFSVRVSPAIANSYSGETPAGGAYTGGAVAATWFINEGTPGGSNATVGLQWNAAQELPGFDRTQSRLGHYTGGAWQLSGAGAAAGSDPYTFSATGFTGFSPFGVLNNNAVLPVRQLVLSVAKTGTAVRCSWVMQGVEDAAALWLERSWNGLEFTAVQALRLSATGTADDAAGSKGKVFYRLRAMDKTGGIKYSNVAWVDNDGQKAIHVFPPCSATR